MFKAILIFALLFVSISYGQTAYAICNLVGGSANPTLGGVVRFYQDGNGNVTVSIDAYNIINPNAMHAVHIHQFGDISFANGTSTGGHLDPNSKPHGCPDTNGTDRHAGDMGNWFVGVDGTLKENKTLDLLSLTGPNSIIGRSVTIHALPDDCVTTSYGARIGQCVIGIPQTVAGISNAAVSGSTATTATCVLQQVGTSGVTGYIYLSQASINSPTTITAEIRGLNNKTRAFHLHQFGDLSDATGALTTGGHYNPFNTSHSLPGYGNPHVGDLGNVYHFENGIGYYKFDSRMVNLTGVNNVIGRSMIVHAEEDICTANYGARIAMCVVGINGGLTSLTVPVTVPATQSNAACATAATSGGSTAPAGTTGSTGTNASSTVSVCILLSLVTLLFNFML